MPRHENENDQEIMKSILKCFVVLTVLFSSCQKDPVLPDPVRCNSTGTVVRAMCGNGAWGDLWIKMNDGKMLQPCISEFNIVPKEGDNIKFAYRALEKNETCENSTDILCLAFPGYADPVKITCLEITGSSAKKCTHRAKVFIEGCFGQPSFILETGEKILASESEFDLYSLQHDEEVEISYEPLVRICGTPAPDGKNGIMGDPRPGISAKITCLNRLRKPSPDECNTMAVVQQMYNTSCEWVLKLENGDIIVPVNVPEGFVFRDKQAVIMSYRQVQTLQAICIPGIPAQITCIRELDKPMPVDPCVPVKISNGPWTHPAEQIIDIQSMKLNGSCLEIQVGYSGCSIERNFNLYWNGQSSNSVNLTLKDMSPPQMCEAYFIRTLKFDIAAIRMNMGPLPITVTVNNFDGSVQF